MISNIFQGEQNITLKHMGSNSINEEEEDLSSEQTILYFFVFIKNFLLNEKIRAHLRASYYSLIKLYGSQASSYTHYT